MIIENHHDWKIFAGSPSPLSESSFSSPYAESLHQIRSGPNSLVNLPCCNSPNCARFSNCSSETHSPRVVNHDHRYHPYHSPISPIAGTVFSRGDIGNFHTNDVRHTGCYKENSFHMQPHLCRFKHGGSTNRAKSNARKKSQKVSKSKYVPSKQNFLARNINNNSLTNFDGNMFLNPVPDYENSVKKEYDGPFNLALPNEQNYAAERRPSQSVTGTYGYNSKPPTNNMQNIPGDLNFRSDFQASEAKAGSKYENQNDSLLSNFRIDHIDSAANVPSENAISNVDMNDFQLVNNFDPSNNQVTPITMPENKFQSVDNFGRLDNEVTHVNMSDNNFQSENNLDLSTNQVTYLSMPVIDFQSMSNFDQSDNQVTHTTNMPENNFQIVINNLDVPNNQVSHTISSSENNFQSVNSLDGSNNQVTHINMPENNFQSVNNLDESNNQVIHVTSLPENNFQSINSFDLSDNQVTHIAMQENSIFNVQDMLQENVENTDMENIFFQPYFKGKNENGENIVIFLANPSKQQGVGEENKANAFVNTHVQEAQNNQEDQNNLAENSSQISEDVCIESGVQKVCKESTGDVFLSNVDDYGSEEIVTTTQEKDACQKSKKDHDKKDKNGDENYVAYADQNTDRNERDISPQASTSATSGNTPISRIQNMNPPCRKCQCKNFKRKRMLLLKRRPFWKTNQPFKNLKRGFFMRLMKRVKTENEHKMVSEEFWNLYRVIATQIGGSVLDAIYGILPALMRNYSGESVSSTAPTVSRAASNSARKRLQVRFPAKSKKKNISGN